MRRITSCAAAGVPTRRWSARWSAEACVCMRETLRSLRHSPPAEDPQAGEGPAAVLAAGGRGHGGQLSVGGRRG